MTQAVNLANFANSLNSSGQIDPNALSSAVPISKGGTGATSASAARTSLDVPSTNGTGATGTWAINVSGTSSQAAKIVSTNWTVEESGGQLLFKYGGVTKFIMDQTNGFTAA